MRAEHGPGRNKVKVRDVPDPKILNDRDAIVRITSTAICGSDLHLYDGSIPSMRRATSWATSPWARSSRSAAVSRSSRSATGSSCRSRSPAASAGPAGRAVLLLRELQPQRGDRRELFGHSAPGSSATRTHRRLRGRSGAVRAGAVADVGPLKVEADLPDEQVLFLSDILPTGYMGAEMCDIQPSDVVAVWAPARSASSPWTAPGSARRREGHRHRQGALPVADGVTGGHTRPVNFV